MFFVMGIMTTLDNRNRRDSLRQTWMPQGRFEPFQPNTSSPIVYVFCLMQCFLGVHLQRLEKEKGIVIRFVIGRRCG
jgi:hypothetical protein